jgi:membrane protease YdiL (CAAX protease family)
VPLLFVQTTSEEMIFRGYLQQRLGARFKNPLIWMVLPSLIFALGHYKPDLDPLVTWSIIAATLVFGVIAADLTRITGSLAAAMGLHFANNFFSLLIIGVPGQLSGLARYHTPYTMQDSDKFQTLLWIDIGLLIVIWLIARRVVR